MLIGRLYDLRAHVVVHSRASQPWSAGDIWGLGIVLLGLVCGGCAALSTSCSTRGSAASLDALQEHIARQLTDQLHEARVNLRAAASKVHLVMQTSRRRMAGEPHHQSLAVLRGFKTLQHCCCL